MKTVASHNVFDILSPTNPDETEDEGDTTLSRGDDTPSSHQHHLPVPQFASLSSHPVTASLSLTMMQQQEEQLLAEKAAVRKEKEQMLRIASLQREIDKERAEVEAMRQSTAMSSLSTYHSTPITPAHNVAPPVNRSLFSSVAYASALKAPVSAAALAKRQSIADLPADPPSVSVSSVYIKHTPPAKFTGEKDSQNADIEQWIDEANTYLELSRVPPSDFLAEVKGLMSGYALKWLKDRREEVEAAHRVMTWPWLQFQLIDEFGRSTGVLAQKAEWLALRMGVKNNDGTEVGGKSTYTVKAYTSHFTRLMRALTPHTPLTTDLAVIDRYCEGVRIGYPTLWAEMKGMHSVLSYDTLSDAITGAQVAESALAVLKLQHSSSSTYRARHTAQVNNIQTDTDDSPSPPRSPLYKKRERKQSTLAANAFVYKPVTEEGRYKLSEAQQKLLYDERRCYRCYGPHHPKMGTCPKKMSAAPSPLK